jgi:hypothetical protein
MVFLYTLKTSNTFVMKKSLTILFFASLTFFSFSQKYDSLRVPAHFGGAVTLTTKGISIIPNLTLGKPAAIFDMSAGRRLSFEPQFRFALEGKPWSFIFWFRYEVVNNKKFQLKIGAHPAFAFSTISDSIGGESQEYIRTTRYLAGDIVPTYFLGKNISTGFYYLYSHGIEEYITQHTHYLAFRVNFLNIKITDKVFMRFYPSVYYLNMDKKDGFYFNSTLALGIRNFPLSVSSLINKTIQTDIPIGDDFLWNVSLIYSFNKKYAAL